MKLLHTMLRVGQLQRSIDFYTQVLGMTLLRTGGLAVERKDRHQCLDRRAWRPNRRPSATKKCV